MKTCIYFILLVSCVFYLSCNGDDKYTLANTEVNSLANKFVYRNIPVITLNAAIVTIPDNLFYDLNYTLCLKVQIVNKDSLFKSIIYLKDNRGISTFYLYNSITKDTVYLYYNTNEEQFEIPPKKLITLDLYYIIKNDFTIPSNFILTASNMINNYDLVYINPFNDEMNHENFIINNQTLYFNIPSQTVIRAASFNFGILYLTS